MFHFCTQFCSHVNEVFQSSFKKNVYPFVVHTCFLMLLVMLLKLANISSISSDISRQNKLQGFFDMQCFVEL